MVDAEHFGNDEDSVIIVDSYYCTKGQMLALHLIQDPIPASSSLKTSTVNLRPGDMTPWTGEEKHLILVNDHTDTPTFYST